MKKILIWLVMILIVGVGGYWGYTKFIKEAKKYSGPVEDVSMMLKWDHQAQFAGNYVAMEKGFYADNGINMSIDSYSRKGSVVDAVLTGKYQFGVAGSEEILLAREEGKPVKAVAVIFKLNPVAAYTLKSSGINRPQDFVGKTVGIERGINVEYLYEAMMTKLGVDRTKIKEVSSGFNADELLAGTVDVATGYSINEPQLAVEAGKEIKIMMMGDYGVDIYADVLFTTEEMIETKPAVVEGFVKATLDGWQYAFEHTTEAVEMTMKYVKEGSSKEHQVNMLRVSIPLINTGGSRLGWMEKSEWEKAQTILYEQKIMKKKINIEDAYTMKFVNDLYMVR